MINALSTQEQLRIEAFVRLTRLETGLRRLLENELSAALGDKWWKGLPADIVENVKDSRLDYLYFPELKKAINAKWSYLPALHEAAQKAQLAIHLEELEPIRNAIAHSRDITARELALVDGTYHLLEGVLLPVLEESRREDAKEPLLGAVLVRVHGMLLRQAPIDADDMTVLERCSGTEPSVSDFLETLLAYDNVRRQAGRSPTLLESLQHDAQASLEKLLGMYKLNV